MNQSTLRHSPKHQACSIVDSVHCAMTKFEFTDNVGRPCSYTGNSQRHRTHDTMPEVLKADGGKNPKSNLGLHHESDNSQDPYLEGEG